jgi:cytochrome c553
MPHDAHVHTIFVAPWQACPAWIPVALVEIVDAARLALSEHETKGGVLDHANAPCDRGSARGACRRPPFLNYNGIPSAPGGLATMPDWTVAARRLRALGLAAVLAAIIAMPLAGVGLQARTPDIELGRYLAAECMTCHRVPAASGGIPNIYGMAELRFAELIKAYRDKRLSNAVMQTIAGRLKDDEIEALAAFFARAKRP